MRPRARGNRAKRRDFPAGEELDNGKARAGSRTASQAARFGLLASITTTYPPRPAFSGVGGNPHAGRRG